MILGLSAAMICGTCLPIMAKDEKMQVAEKTNQLNWVIEPRFEDIMDEHHGSFVVKEQGKCGVVDETGNWIIKPQYDEMRGFEDELAAVKQNGKWGFINVKGEMVIPCKYTSVSDFSEGLAGVCMDDNGEVYNEEEGCINFPDAAIDKTGKVVIDFNKLGESYDGIIWGFYGFSEGMGKILSRGDAFDTASCYIDKQGNILLQKNYANIGAFHEGLAWVIYCEESQESIWANYEKNNNYEPKYEGAYINAQGKPVIDKVPYATIFDFSEGLARVISKEEKWGCIDKKGKLVIPCIYDEIWPAREGMAGIRKGELRGFINLKGNIVIKPQFSGISLFSGGVALAIKPGEDTVNLIDKKGNILISGQENMSLSESGEYIWVCKNGKWGVIKNPLK